jgi:hypothetical protein
MAYIEEIDLTEHGINPGDPIFLVITTDDSDDGKSIFYLNEV